MKISDKGFSDLSAENLLPDFLQMGDFQLMVKEYTNKGQSDFDKHQAFGVSGVAWLKFDCRALTRLEIDPTIPIDPHLGDRIRIRNKIHVVPVVSNPQTEISLEKARQIRPAIKIGQNLNLDFMVSAQELQEISESKEGLITWLIDEKKDLMLVKFDDVTIDLPGGASRPGSIMDGTAVYPADPYHTDVIQLSVDGFIISIDSLVLTPSNATANIILQLPESIASAETHGPAFLNIGQAEITSNCRIYVEDLNASYGPWIIGDTGIVVNGTGYILDLCSTKSPQGKAKSWKGLALINGIASGDTLIPKTSNIGYLGGKYTFSTATITKTGFEGSLILTDSYKFDTIYPFDYSVKINKGILIILNSRIKNGALVEGSICLPVQAVCDKKPGNRIRANFDMLFIQESFLYGPVFFDPVSRICFGELTNSGDEIISWGIQGNRSIFCLPSNPLPTFSLDENEFPKLSFADILSDPKSFYTNLKSGLAGVIITEIDSFWIYSPDHSDGTSGLPIQIVPSEFKGWLRIGSRGVDGEIIPLGMSMGIDGGLGNEERSGYVGGSPFKIEIISRESLMRFRFISSAIYDSIIHGYVVIPDPCDIRRVDFYNMHATSTANMVGGNIDLPKDGVTLDYWKLQLVPNNYTKPPGVMSIRTGRIIFTAAGVSEPVHFQNPFLLTWGEMLADGNLGELFFDYMSLGQRFDGFSFSPHRISLSKYVVGSGDAYLAVNGTVHINFFGTHFINIYDARYSEENPPYNGRNVSIPEQGDDSSKPTDLHLYREWDNSVGDALVTFDFPNSGMEYNKITQNGFEGKGSAVISFLPILASISKTAIDADIEIHADEIDIRLSSSEKHNIQLGPLPSLGGMTGIRGCARIQGPLLKRISLYGYLERSSITGTGTLEPRAASVIEVNITTTPSSLDFYAAGDMVLSAAFSALDISASAHLFFDHAKDIIEGDLSGSIDCSNFFAGLKGEGQVTWYKDPSTQYLQGKLKVSVCSWTIGGGLEGGLFIGENVDKSKAWVLYTGNEHFGVSDAILPKKLTGLFGYGQVSYGVNYWLFGGGIELYAGMGAFELRPDGLSTLPLKIAGGNLPYVLGNCGVYIHGEILGGLVSASAWANLQLRGPVPTYYEGRIGLEGCAGWVLCASIKANAGLNDHGFYIY